MTELFQSGIWVTAAAVSVSGIWQAISSAVVGFFSSPTISDALNVVRVTIAADIWETIYASLLSTFLAYVIGLPLGVAVVVGEPGNVRPLPKWLMDTFNFIINILRSVPFLILMIIALPLSRLAVGTTIGTKALIIPLTIAAFPFIARLVESSLRDTDRGVVEAAQSMGASPSQIIWRVMIPEAMPSLISGATIALMTIIGYDAMAGIIGGGGLGRTAINYGYYRSETVVMWIEVVILIILVQIFQSVGTKLAVKSDKRITQNNKRRRKQ